MKRAIIPHFRKSSEKLFNIKNMNTIFEPGFKKKGIFPLHPKTPPITISNDFELLPSPDPTIAKSIDQYFIQI